MVLVGLPLLDYGHHIGSYLLPPVLWPHNQVAKPFPFPLIRLPTLVRFGITKLFHGQTRVLQLVRVHEVDVRAVTGVLKSLGLLLDVFENGLVKLWRLADFELLYFGSEKLVDLLLNVVADDLGSGLEQDALLRDEEIDTVIMLLL